MAKLRQQLDAAMESGTPAAYAALAQALAEALRLLSRAHPAAVPGDELGPALLAIEDAWFKGTPPSAPLPGSPDRQAQLMRLLDEVMEVQAFAVCLAKGDLSPSLKVKGAMAGGLKSLQSSLRHLTWQTQRIATGDFSQRVDFMGEFSASFNAMTRNLAEARDQLKAHGEELARANASLRAEIAERHRAENLIQDLNRQLEHKVADLIEANKDMEAFSYSVSHDLRAPLRAIQGYARMLMEEHVEGLDAEGLRLLKVISHNARLMAKLIE
ncbi:MAG: histidine kinase dimerization/phospho-acceptor domain-containing protein, partial [Desulfobaccales bacterium]